MMHARYEIATRRLRHWSTVPFSVAPGADETDREFPDGTALPGERSQLRLTAALTSLEIDPALVPPPPETPDAMRQALGNIFVGTALQKRQRWVGVLEQYPAAAVFLTLLRGPLTPDARMTLTEIATRIRAKIGNPANEVLTQAEYDALKALAAQHNITGMIP